MKKIVSLALVLSLCLSLMSCFDAEYEKDMLAPAAEKISVSYNDARAEDYVQFIDKLERFAAKLTYEICFDSEMQTNICISPVSVYMALALATECSGGETREEMLRAVGVGYEEVRDFTKYLYAFSNREFYYTDMLENKRVSAFEELSNSIWADDGVELHRSGIDNLAQNFNCDLFRVDFMSSNASRAINAYIKDKTHGVIDAGLDLSPETLITLINTFYLKEIWNAFGDELRFADDVYDFRNADGSVKKTFLLRGYYFNGKAYEGDGFTSFFTRTNHGFDIKFILPSEGRTLDEVFTPENIYTVNNFTDWGYKDDENMLLHHTRVLFPEYKADYDGDIADILREDFGIESLFDIKRCDFSGITDAEIACEGVIHKCSIDVNARGIEGAAVTVIPGAGAAGPGPYTDVYHDYAVDGAFGFILTDAYGVVLFSGVINSIK